MLNLDKAYPAAAGIKKLIRKIDFSGNKVVLEDSFTLAAPKSAKIRFLSPCKAEKISASSIKIGGTVLEMKGIELVSIRGLPKMNGSWNLCLTEIMLESTSNHYRLTFKPAE